ADQTTNRRVVDDGAASLLAHLAQLILHAVPDAAQINPVYTIEFLAGHISQFHGRRLYAGVVERRIEATEGGYNLRNHCCYLSFVSDIAANGDCLVTGGDDVSRCSDFAGCGVWLTCVRLSSCPLVWSHRS